jgi:hypothetical protein
MVGPVRSGQDTARRDRTSLSRGYCSALEGGGAGDDGEAGIPTALKSPAEVAAMLPGEVQKWAAVIRAANVTVE